MPTATTLENVATTTPFCEKFGVARSRATVNRLTDAVHRSVCEIADMVMRADAARRVAHVRIEARGTARRLVLDLAPPAPARPVIDEAALLAGTWAGTLVAIAEPYRESLSQLLFDAPRLTVSRCPRSFGRRCASSTLRRARPSAPSRRFCAATGARLWRHRR